MVVPFPVCRQVYSHQSRPPSAERSRPSGDQIRPTEFFAPNPVPISVHSSGSVLCGLGQGAFLSQGTSGLLSGCKTGNEGPQTRVARVAADARERSRNGPKSGLWSNCGLSHTIGKLSVSAVGKSQNRGRATAGARFNPSDSPWCRICLWEWPVVSGSVCVPSGRRLRPLPVITTEDTPFGRRLLYCRCGPSLAPLGVVSGRRFRVDNVTTNTHSPTHSHACAHTFLAKIYLFFFFFFFFFFLSILAGKKFYFALF